MTRVKSALVEFNVSLGALHVIALQGNQKIEYMFAQHVWSAQIRVLGDVDRARTRSVVAPCTALPRPIHKGKSTILCQCNAGTVRVHAGKFWPGQRLQFVSKVLLALLCSKCSWTACHALPRSQVPVSWQRLC